MAYVIGLATDAEIEDLKSRGWEIEPTPKELVTDENVPDESDPLTSIMIWVDSNLMDIMDGAGWDESPLREEVLAQISEIEHLENQYRLGTHDFKSLLKRVAGIKGADDCLGRPGACSPTCPGWGWFLSLEHGYIIEQCDECSRFKSDLKAQLHTYTCDRCRESSRSQLNEIIEAT